MTTFTYTGGTVYADHDPASEDVWYPPIVDKLTDFDEFAGRVQIPFDIRYPEETDYRLLTNSRSGYTIKSATFETDSGTLTAAVKINSTAVTGLSAVSVTSTESQTNGTASNTVAIGDNIVLTLSSVSGVTSLRGNIWLDRTSAGTA